MTSPERSTPASTRRRLLAGLAAGLAATAGCLEGGPRTDDEDPPTASPTDTPDYHTHGSSYLDLRAYPADVATEWARASADLPEDGEAVVEDAIGQGTGSYESWEGSLLDDGAHVEHDGTYYRVHEEQTGTRDLEGHRMELETLTVSGEPGDWTTPATVTEARERAVDFANLSAVDRRIVREGVGEEYRGESGFASSYPVVVDEDDAENATLLSAEPRYVRYQGELLSIYREEAEDIVAVVYEYDLEQVAEATEAFVAHVEREHVLDLDAADLSEEERGLFESATEATVERESPFSDAVESLLDRLRDHEHNPLNRHPYASYEGTVYRVEVMLAVP
jgi:hypothetical protein